MAACRLLHLSSGLWRRSNFLPTNPEISPGSRDLKNDPSWSFPYLPSPLIRTTTWSHKTVNSFHFSSPPLPLPTEKTTTFFGGGGGGRVGWSIFGTNPSSLPKIKSTYFFCLPRPVLREFVCRVGGDRQMRRRRLRRRPLPQFGTFVLSQPSWKLKERKD